MSFRIPSYLFPFALLRGLHSIWQFSMLVEPPLLHYPDAHFIEQIEWNRHQHQRHQIRQYDDALSLGYRKPRT